MYISVFPLPVTPLSKNFSGTLLTTAPETTSKACSCSLLRVTLLHTSSDLKYSGNLYSSSISSLIIFFSINLSTVALGIFKDFLISKSFVFPSLFNLSISKCCLWLLSGKFRISCSKSGVSRFSIILLTLLSFTTDENLYFVIF